MKTILKIDTIAILSIFTSMYIYTHVHTHICVYMCLYIVKKDLINECLNIL